MITCGLAMDVLIFIVISLFLYEGRSWRFPVTVSIFYITRVFVQLVFTLKDPEGYYWKYPGFYSITVPYGEIGDFFYSGHLGMCMIAYLELDRTGHSKLKWYAIFTLLMQAFVLTITRSHFLCDFFTGVICSHYFFIMVEHYI